MMKASLFVTGSERAKVRLQIGRNDDDLWRLSGKDRDLANDTINFGKHIESEAVCILASGKDDVAVVVASGPNHGKPYVSKPFVVAPVASCGFHDFFSAAKPVVRVALSIGRLPHHRNQRIAVPARGVVKVLTIVAQKEMLQVFWEV